MHTNHIENERGEKKHSYRHIPGQFEKNESWIAF